MKRTLLFLGLSAALGLFAWSQNSNQNNFGGGGSLPTGLTYVAPTLTVSVAGSGNGVLALSGNTSGVATITAPAVAGTAANPIVFSNSMQAGSIGTVVNPAYAFSAQTNSGLVYGLCPGIVSLGVQTTRFCGTTMDVAANVILTWVNNNTLDSGTRDTGFDRQAAGVVEVNAGAAGGTGRLKAAAYMSVGTTFTSNAGCTESALTGGATAGKFSVGQSTACTIVITMGNAATAPNGWTCTAYDQTSVPTVAIRQTASNGTTCSLGMQVTSADVITFSAIGY